MTLPICPIFLGCIEPQSLRVIQLSGQGIGASISADRRFVRLIRRRGAVADGVVTIAGVRVGFADWHFKPFTQAQMERNRRFYRSAYAS